MLVFVELVADLLAGCALPFRAKSTELNSVRAAAQDQLEASWSRLSRLKDLERSKDTLVSHYATLVFRHEGFGSFDGSTISG